MRRRASLEDAERSARRIADGIAERIAEGWGFAVILTSTDGQDGSMTYVSNLERTGMIRLFRELATRLESGEGRLGIERDERLSEDFAEAIGAWMVPLLMKIGEPLGENIEKRLRDALAIVERRAPELLIQEEP